MRHLHSMLVLGLLPVLACAAGAALPPTVAVASPQPGSPASGAGTRIAVVDLQLAVTETRDGRRAQDELKRIFDNRQQELDAKQAEIAREREVIERQASTLPKSDVEKRMAELQRRVVDLQSLTVDYQKHLEKRQGELTAPILSKMKAVVARTAEEDGYDVVLDKQAAPYARRSLDLTDRVIKAYEDGA